jgi:hypothetical protein
MKGAQSMATHLYVAPDGKPNGKGTKDSPLDLKSAFTDAKRVRAGVIVWIAGGTYDTGDLSLNPEIRGTPQMPIIIRAAEGGRATLTGKIILASDYVWLWGLEITGASGDAVTLRAGRGVKLINMVIHGAKSSGREAGNAIECTALGDGHEYYGNLLYGNGQGSSGAGTRTFNSAPARANRIADNFSFQNTGPGLFIFARAPIDAGYEIEGNVAFANSLAGRSQRGTPGGTNFYVNSAQPMGNFLFASNCSWPAEATGQRINEIIDCSFNAEGKRRFVVEDNYMVHSVRALSLRGLSQAVIRNNTIVSPEIVFEITYAQDSDKPNVVLENNTYVSNDFDLAKLRAETGSAKTDKVVKPPAGVWATGTHVCIRPNQYEPDRVHLAVYNWDKKDEVQIDLKGLLKKGDTYRVVSALDFFGKPVTSGIAESSSITLPMKGHACEPAFGAYVLFRGTAEK